MKRLLSLAAMMSLAAFILAASAAPVHAQRAGFIRLFRPYHQVVLAQLTEVQDGLKLTDEQKQKADGLYDELNQERGALFQEAGGNFESIREDWNQLNHDIASDFNEALDEGQRQRLQELYVQANGPTALFEEQVAGALKLTAEQQQKLQEIRDQSREDFQGIDWQSLGEEELDAKIDELIAAQNEKYSAVLTDDQRAEFEKLQGEKLEIDLGNLPNPFGG